MKFIPSHEIKIIPEESFETEIVKIENEINEVKTTGVFSAFDGTEIYYEYFLAKDSKASVVIVHGLSEFTEKFYEFAYYCLKQGYNVFIYDQRCHGLSGRLTDKVDLLHVDSFDDYVKDLSQFIDEIVVKIQVDKPVYIYSHSMGAAVATMYLERNKGKVEKAVLAAPMFLPVVKEVPTNIGRAGVGIGKLFYGAKTKFLLSGEFDPDVQYLDEKGTSKARFEHNMNLRRGNINYQSTPMTFGWVYNSLIINKKINRKKAVKNIDTPLLLLSAGSDTVVQNKPQYLFAKKCKLCRLVNIEDATHALLASNNAIMEKIINLIFEFYEG